MTSDLGLARNLSGLGLAAESNHIYPSHVTAGITIAFPLRRELRRTFDDVWFVAW
jgi:hypothetical protein